MPAPGNEGHILAGLREFSAEVSANAASSKDRKFHICLLYLSP
jgi:hypothetical protein